MGNIFYVEMLCFLFLHRRIWTKTKTVITFVNYSAYLIYIYMHYVLLCLIRTQSTKGTF